MILAINLYCKTPFGKIDKGNPKIIELAKVLDRTPSSVGLKLANFASIDPSLDRKGASHTSKLDRQVWAEFFGNWDEMVTQSEEMVSKLVKPKQGFGENPNPEFDYGEDIQRTVSVRKNQQVFREMILSSYNSRCCITGVKNSEVLVASHIIPWSQDTNNRLNPMNGLCLNALHDRAFDRNLITLGEEYEVIVSSKLEHRFFKEYENKIIEFPSRFLPDQDFLEHHRKTFFDKENSVT